MKRTLLSLAMIALVGVLAIGATIAQFEDTETSNDNTFTAGTLDLTVDGNNGINTIKFTVADMKPGDFIGANGTGLFTDPGNVQCTGGAGYSKFWTLRNIGSVNGYLDLDSVVKTEAENTRWEPEISSGDTTDATGELMGRLQALVWIESDNNHCVTAGEQIYKGPLSGFSTVERNELISAGTEKRLLMVVYWAPGTTAEDNVAMSDGVDLDMTFQLAQTTAQ
jgi:predicted ribosomally synthesized peptide with SipW-like signal peptide